MTSVPGKPGKFSFRVVVPNGDGRHISALLEIDQKAISDILRWKVGNSKTKRAKRGPLTLSQMEVVS